MRSGNSKLRWIGLLLAVIVGGSGPVLAQLNAATTGSLPYRQIVRSGESLDGPRGLRLRIAPNVHVDNGRLSEARRTIEQAQRLLHDELALAQPSALEIVFADLAGEPSRWLEAGVRRPALILIDARRGVERSRDALIARYAAAVAAHSFPALDTEWRDAFGVWAVQAVRGEASREQLEAMRPFFQNLEQGLLGEEAFNAGGRLVWLHFVGEAYGLDALRLSLAAIAASDASVDAIGRGLEALESDLPAALRELHLWSLLTGHRDDGNHFTFAGALRATPFASRMNGLPAISVRANRPVAPFGAAQVEFFPATERGGMEIAFEGEFSIDWSVDLLLHQEDGARYRIPLELEEGRGEMTLPLQNVDSVWLLVRNVGGERPAPGRYTVIAHQEQRYPMVLAELDVAPQPDDASQMLSWQTESEEGDLIGFNVLRRRAGGGPVVAVNPVPIPALGEPDAATSYLYLDVAAEAGIEYEYRIEAVTRSGLTTNSRAVRTPASR